MHVDFPASLSGECDKFRSGEIRLSHYGELRSGRSHSVDSCYEVSSGNGLFQRSDLGIGDRGAGSVREKKYAHGRVIKSGTGVGIVIEYAAVNDHAKRFGRGRSTA